MITIENLSKEFAGGVKALKKVDMEIKRGEFIILLGPSGAGKSTLLRCINGLVKPSSGVVTVNGLDVNGGKKELREVRRQVGMIFQQFNLVKRLTVLDNVLCGSLAANSVFTSCLNIFSDEDRKYALHCLERVGMLEKAPFRADQLSGGQQQRVGIARALVQKPMVFLADEPVASLDPVSSIRVMELLRQINQQDGITVVVSLHDVALAKQFGQRVIGIQDGNVVLDGSINQISEAQIRDIYEGKLEEMGEVVLEEYDYPQADKKGCVA